MKGLRAQEVLLSQAEEHKDFRLEAEFFTAKTALTADSYTGTEAIPYVQYGTSEQLNETNDGYPVLRLNEITGGFINEPEKFCSRINKIEFESLMIKKGDVLVCRTNGNPKLVGKSAVAMEDTDFAFASYLFRVRPDPAKISAECLSVFLNSKIGRAEIEKHSIRSNQVNFSPDKIKQIRIPRFGNELRELIDRVVIAAYSSVRSSQNLYIQAEELLLEALSLRNWQPPEPLTYEQKSSAAFAAGRLDAEHFQPQYDALLNHLHQHAPRSRIIRDFAAYCDRGEQPQYYKNGALSVVNSRHILEKGLDYDNFERTDAKYWNDLAFVSARIQKHDILTYMTGANVGRTAVFLSEEKALASNEVNILRLNKENPLYVAVVLNSKIGRMQTRRAVTGSAQVHLYPNDIANFTIPFVDEVIERSIATKVEASYTARKRAKGLLEAAKRAVEIAIENSEAVALSFLETAFKEEVS